MQKTFIQKAYEKLRFAKSGDITLMVGISQSTNRKGMYLVYTGTDKDVIIPLARVLTSGDCEDINPLALSSEGLESMLEVAFKIDDRSIAELDNSNEILDKLFKKSAVLLDKVIEEETEEL